MLNSGQGSEAVSHRTIIEVNHDYLHDFMEDPDRWNEVLRKLFMNDWGASPLIQVFGVRKVGERHHSESITIKVE